VTPSFIGTARSSGRAEALRALPTGRRAKWIVVGVWIALAIGLGWMQPRLQAQTETDPAAFIPDGAESTRAMALVQERLPSADVTPAIVVYTREGGLTERDFARIDADADRISDRLPLDAPVVSPTRAPPQDGMIAPDGSAAIINVPLSADAVERVEPAVRELRAVAGETVGEGLSTHVTGPAALTVDAVDVFSDIDLTLLIATTVLIVVLLVAIYRSPLIALVPLIMVGGAYAVAAGIVYLLVTGAGLAINPQATGILIVLMFGAGTDYSLLVIARLREELRRQDDHHAAVADAMRGTTPAILASGGTVAAAMLVLLLADLRSTATQGPVLAIGIAAVLAAGLTLLPALLSIAGRRAFWPAVPTTDDDGRGVHLWRRVAAGVSRRPIPVLLVTVAVLGAGAAGNLVNVGGLTFTTGFRDEPPSVVGQRALADAFPPGELAPTIALVQAPPEDLDAASAAVAEATEGLPIVASAAPVESDPTGTVARLRLTLAEDPYGDAAVEAVGDVRAAARAAAEPAGATVLVGGPTAEEADLRETVRRDFRIIAPLALALIFVILVILLRALVAPAYLVLSQILSFATALGVALLSFAYLFDSPGSDAALPTFVFIFTVALGVDYTIFLMTRVREEARRHGTREAVPIAVARTGGVITSAGIILAGTFLVLTVLPLEQLFQVGVAVGIGILVDTFIVRTLLVPSIALLLDRWNWWPTGRRTHADS
jgi:putative drug exporter of the RND superfamily